MSAGAIYALANIASAGVPFLLLPILTRVLDHEEYGQVTNFLLVNTACGAVAGLSLHAAIGVRWFDRQKLDFPRFVSSAVIVSVVSTLVVALLAGLIATFFNLNFGLSPVWVALAAVSAGCASLMYARSVLWQSQQRPYLAAALQFSNSLVNGLLSIFAVIVLHLGGKGRMGGVVVSAIALGATSVVLLYRLGDARGGATREFVLASLRFGLPLVPHAVAAAVIASADRFFVSKQLGPASIGIYGVAAQLGLVMMVIADAFSKAYSPWLYDKLAKGTPSDLQAVVGTTYLIVPLFGVLAVLISAAIYVAGTFILGPKFQAALPLLWWFVLGGAFIGMYYSVAGLFFATGQTELISAMTGTAAVLGLVISFCMVKLYGMTGGAISYALTQLLMYALTFGLAVRLRPLPWRSVRSCIRSALQDLR